MFAYIIVGTSQDEKAKGLFIRCFPHLDKEVADKHLAGLKRRFPSHLIKWTLKEERIIEYYEE